MKRKYMVRLFICILAIALSCRAGFAVVIKAECFGVKADGTTDDGPAILAMVRAAKAQNGAHVKLSFPPNKKIYAETGEDGYLFPLNDAKNITMDGGSSTFLLHKDIRMVNLEYARNVVLRKFNVDYKQTPFIECTVTGLSTEKQTINVKPNDQNDLDQLLGRTGEENAGRFYGMVWCVNENGLKVPVHYEVKAVKDVQNNKTEKCYVFKVLPGIPFSFTPTNTPNGTPFSAPRAGVANIMGPGALFRIHDTCCTTLEDITVWAAPWFAFSIYRCEGTCSFTNVNVIPYDNGGETRLMSATRDAFHVTANRAKLLFKNCKTSGTGDDDYNFCILNAAINHWDASQPKKLVIQQRFNQTQYNPMRVGDTLMVMTDSNEVIGSAEIAEYNEIPFENGQPIVPGGACPKVNITLEKTIPALDTVKDIASLTVWSKEAANPTTAMISCTARFSTRWQTSLMIDSCKFYCLSLSYGMYPDTIRYEGPGPEMINITNTEFFVGRLGGGYHAYCDGTNQDLEKLILQRAYMNACTFDAPLIIDKAKEIIIKNSKFKEAPRLGEYKTITCENNTVNERPWDCKQ